MPEKPKEIFIIDESGKILMQPMGNSGYFSSKMVSQNFFDHLVPDSVSFLKSKLTEIDEKTWSNFELVFNTDKDNSETVDVRIFPMQQTESKDFSFLLELTLKSLVRLDISIFQYIFNSVNEAIYITDFDGNFILMNDEAIRRIGDKAKENKKLNLFDTNFINKSNSVRNYFNELITENQSVAYAEYIDSVGNTNQIEVSGKKISHYGKDYLLHVSREISPRKSEFNQLLEQIIQADEIDRSYFAQEIHEGIGQIVSLIKLYMESYFDSDNVKFKKELAKKMDSSVNHALAIIPLIAEKLSPHILKNLGIEAALKAHIHKITKSREVVIRFESNIIERIPSKIEIVLYRALVDLIDYSINCLLANNIMVSLNIENCKIIFKLTHNGNEFNFDSIQNEHAEIRIKNLISKVQSLSGNFEAINNTRGMVVFKINVPLKT